MVRVFENTNLENGCKQFYYIPTTVKKDCVAFVQYSLQGASPATILALRLYENCIELGGQHCFRAFSTDPKSRTAAAERRVFSGNEEKENGQ